MGEELRRTMITQKFIYKSPIGSLEIISHDGHIKNLNILTDTPPTVGNIIHPEIESALKQYFQNAKHLFRLRLEPEGSEFQKKIWQALCQIPVGSVMTYGDLAKQFGSSPRAIGNACRNNPIPILIPCHRVVAKNHLGGYSGAVDGHYLEMKKWLLQHEKAYNN